MLGILPIIACVAVASGAASSCTELGRTEQELFSRQYARLPSHLKIAGLELHEGESLPCVGAVRGDFDGNGLPDIVAVLAPTREDLYVWAAFQIGAELRPALVKVLHQQKGPVALRLLPPGRYSGRGPVGRALEPGEREEINSERPGVILTVGSGPVGLAFFLASERWLHVRVEPQ